jgi:hypothetical protein
MGTDLGMESEANYSNLITLNINFHSSQAQA